MKKRVTWEGGYIIVRSGSVADELNAQIITADLMNAVADPAAKGFWQHFGELCSQTEASENLPFKPENVRAMTLLDKQRAYDAYLRTPKAVRQKWTQALNAVNNTAGVSIEEVDEEIPKP